MPKLKRNAPKKVKEERIKQEMEDFKKGDLHSGSKKGPIVKKRDQAIAIALNEAGKLKKKKKSK